MTYQKLLQSLAKRGVVGTIIKAGALTLGSLQCQIDARFDRYHRVNTSGRISLDKLRIDSRNVAEGIWYEPVSPSYFRQLIGELGINFENYFFIDFGSGKGRALFLAAEYPFARVLGVEFSPELHAVALQNIKTYRNSKQRCFQIESVCIDAVNYELPPVQSVLFFYSPFRESVMSKVMDNIMRSLKKSPRSVYVLYVGVISESIQVLKNSNLSCREVKLRPDYIRSGKKRGMILHSGISEELQQPVEWHL